MPQYVHGHAVVGPPTPARACHRTPDRTPGARAAARPDPAATPGADARAGRRPERRGASRARPTEPPAPHPAAGGLRFAPFLRAASPGIVVPSALIAVPSRAAGATPAPTGPGGDAADDRAARVRNRPATGWGRRAPASTRRGGALGRCRTAPGARPDVVTVEVL